MNTKEYLDASARTAKSGDLYKQFGDDTILGEFRRAIEAGQRIDVIKKGLYYGKEVPVGFTNENIDSESTDITDRVNIDILHGVLGIFTEATELMEAVYESMTSPKPSHDMNTKIDEVNLVEELGDLEWYMAMMYRTLGTTPEVAKQINIDKLTLRYPDAFTTEAAINRDTDAERELLEKG